MSVIRNLTVLNGGLSLKSQLPIQTTDTGLTHKIVKEEVVLSIDYHVQCEKETAYT
jgi:hypothetical protein